MKPIENMSNSRAFRSMSRLKGKIFGFSMAEITVLSGALINIPIALLPHITHGEGWSTLTQPLPVLTIIGQIGIALGSAAVVRTVHKNGHKKVG